MGEVECPHCKKRFRVEKSEWNIVLKYWISLANNFERVLKKNNIDPYDKNNRKTG